jgi:hypothetical protein
MKDVLIAAEINVVQNKAGKKLKYESLCILVEICRMSNTKYMIISVITEATGITTKGLKKILKAIPGKHSIDSLKIQLFLEHHT